MGDSSHFPRPSVQECTSVFRSVFRSVFTDVRQRTGNGQPHSGVRLPGKGHDPITRDLTEAQRERTFTLQS